MLINNTTDQNSDCGIYLWKSDNNLIKTLFLSKDILDEMTDIIEEIIEIQNKIIDQEIPTK